MENLFFIQGSITFDFPCRDQSSQKSLHQAYILMLREQSMPKIALYAVTGGVLSKDLGISQITDSNLV